MAAPGAIAAEPPRGHHDQRSPSASPSPPSMPATCSPSEGCPAWPRRYR